MPYVNFVYRDLVFQMISVNGDPALQTAVTKAAAGTVAGEKKHKFTLPVNYQRVLELFLTKREVWYFDQKAWDATKLSNSMIDFYAQAELESASSQILNEVSKAASINYRKDVKLARITIHTFSESGDNTTAMEASVAHYA